MRCGLCGRIAWRLLGMGLMLACRFAPPPATPTIVRSPPVASPTPALVRTPPPAVMPTPSPTVFALPTVTPTPEPLAPEDVHFYPDPLYAGDWVSVDVLPRLAGAVTDPMTLTLTLPDGTPVEAAVASQGLDGRRRARFVWVWQAPAEAGMRAMTLTLRTTAGVVATLPLTVTLRDPGALLPPEPWARWAVTETEGVRLHYLTHSAAARDLPSLMAMARDAYAAISAQLGPSEERVELYVLSRVIGQGGYASSQWVAVSYVDRMYAPIALETALRHELVHRLDDAIGCDAAPALLREGLAVYGAGGHYRPESLPRRAAAAIALGRDVPLATLARDFYTHQHEVGYLEAGAMMAYVVERHGWAGVETLCRAAVASEASDAMARVAAGVRALGYAGLADFEMAWRASLPPPGDETEVLAVELRLMEAMRAYQQTYDPGAYFLEGLFFDPAAGEVRGIVADFVRHPRTAENITLELLLARAQEALASSRPAEAQQYVEATEAVLRGGFDADPLASTVLAMVRQALATGREPYRLMGGGAEGFWFYALDRAHWPRRR